MKKLILLLLVIAALGGGVYWYKNRAVEKPVEEKTAVAAISDIVEKVTASGTVDPNLDVEIKCKASGEIVELPVEVGDSVKKGQLLMRLDPEDEENSLKKAKANLRSAEAELRMAEKTLEVSQKNLVADRENSAAKVKSAETSYSDAKTKAKRNQELYAKALISKEEMETSLNGEATALAALEAAKSSALTLEAKERALEIDAQKIESARAAVENYTLALEQAQLKVKETSVYSPLDGVVTQRGVQKGQIISSATSNVGGGTTIMVVSDLGRIFVLASVDESDIGVVKAGQKAVIKADAYPKELFMGEVQRIAPRGTVNSNVVTFEVKIEIGSPNKNLLKPQMTTTSEIMTESRKNVVAVPSDCVYRSNGGEMVTVLTASGKEERAVKTGIGDGQNIQIVSGLSAGEKVLVQKAKNGNWSNNRGPMPGPLH